MPAQTVYARGTSVPCHKAKHGGFAAGLAPRPGAPGPAPRPAFVPARWDYGGSPLRFDKRGGEPDAQNLCNPA